MSVALQGCHSKETVFSCTCTNQDLKAINVYRWQVGNADNLNHQQLVEVEGFYRFGSEESAIYRNKASLDKLEKSEALWLTFNESCLLAQSEAKRMLIKSPKELARITGKKIVVRGILNKANTGHLNQYKGTIFKICYFKYID